MRVAGIDVGGTKVAAGIVDLATGAVTERRQITTAANRGALAVLDDCIALARSLAPTAIGIGVCELVDPAGRTRSAYTLDWSDRDLAVDLGVVAPTAVESDVRAAARAEARFGAGRGRSSFLYVTVSTGISHALVIGGEPWPGHRGNAIVLGSPPVEETSSGRALALHAGADRAEDVLADPDHDGLVVEAAEALGHELADLVNALDPEVVVVGGGLGLDDRYRALFTAAMRRRIFAEDTRELPVLAAALGADAGIVGAALSAPVVCANGH